ncbi:hypothetical protein SAMN05421806_11257 [Streptomyces indicus]|uniref:Uncharacterized protein n=2 Tax=Streptomyces indicus TaxID=417292 RepID=A0A1G9ETK3_9ACTN|nr:hypothetical protein SAMN05421806_11257 [Streptomyces indicus]
MAPRTARLLVESVLLLVVLTPAVWISTELHAHRVPVDLVIGAGAGTASSGLLTLSYALRRFDLARRLATLGRCPTCSAPLREEQSR